ncbi:hypothetical protein ScPMuIL_001025 [Solemya velum]
MTEGSIGQTIQNCRNCLTILLFVVVIATVPVSSGSGCADGTREGLRHHREVAACGGQWTGHINNGSSLCAPGWKVCSWHDREPLQAITWEEAISVQGCYAYNAAQDGGRCRACEDNMDQDDLAGLGGGCPHKNQGQSSCISGGRIDASCCVDSHFQKACQYHPGIADGILCCKMPTRKPKIVVKPKERMAVYTGLIFLLTCQASGVPPPRIVWYKDGTQLPANNQRISVLSSGDLLVTLAKKSDTGLYSCEVINEEGIDMASSRVTVREYASGCRDGSTDGLGMHRDIHACSGKWNGHIKRGKSLCRKGWRVCSPHDKEALQELTWLDIFDLDGCYAYNAANQKGRCKRCHTGPLAGVGNTCGRLKYSQTSCLAHGRIDVFKHTKDETSCDYKEGVTNGVLCCKRKVKKSKPNNVCDPACANGGICVGHNRCQCAIGYKGAMCQNAICERGCGETAHCVKPGKCECKPGYTGRGCKRKAKHICKVPCLNGGRCRKSKCKCGPTHTGKSCQYFTQQILLTHLNRTER